MENEVCDLSNKSCVPCRGGVPPLNAQEIESYRKQVGTSWKVNSQGHLHKEFIFD
jgi:4a-hydroxytetrahydrobiopterin dehydratase